MWPDSDFQAPCLHTAAVALLPRDAPACTMHALIMLRAAWRPLPHHHLCCRHLEYEDAWALFGEGRHPHARRLFETRLAPFMSQTAITFWQDRMWYFDQGLYYQGGMVSPH